MVQVVLLLLLLLTIAPPQQQQQRHRYYTLAFVVVPRSQPQPQRHDNNIGTVLYGNKPQRLDDNIEGVVYVNDRCINCAACAGFASHIFRSSEHHDAHIVYEQPHTISDYHMTRAALAACPVAAIRVESYGERNHRQNIINRNHNMEQNSNTQTEERPSNLHLDVTTVTTKDQQLTTRWTDQDDWTLQQMTSKDMKRPFPRPFLMNEVIEGDNSTSVSSTTTTTAAVPDVYWVGHHNEASFGAIPYLVKAEYNHNTVWIMIDVPKYNVQSIRDVTLMTGPNGPHYLFLTHVDDTADHEKWANHFNNNATTEPQYYCQRIFHSGDLGQYNWIGDTSLEQVPILLLPSNNNNETSTNGLTAYTLNGTCISETNDRWLEQFEAGELHTDVIILHTPGHSPGSCTLYKRRRMIHDAASTSTSTTTTIPGILFTGDTYAYSGRHHRMTGFPRYGHDLVQQHHTITQLIATLSAWDIIAPGHGLPRDYRNVVDAVRIQEMKEAQQELNVNRRRR